MSITTPKSNLPNNFRASNSLITTKKPHYSTKGEPPAISIIPGLNRPNANGINSNINNSDYNGPNFKARPLKQWRRQLRPYNYKEASNVARNATIFLIQQPGGMVYHKDGNCYCDDSSGNSFIIDNNKFGGPEKQSINGTIIQNNAYIKNPSTYNYYNPSNNQDYQVYTGVYDTNCISCNSENNIIKHSISFQSQAFFSDRKAYLQSRCLTYDQNNSCNKEPGIKYVGANGEELYPNNTPVGPQVVQPYDYTNPNLKPDILTLYNLPNGFYAVGSVNTINSVLFTPPKYCYPISVTAQMYVNSTPTQPVYATIYDSTNNVICISNGILPIQNMPPPSNIQTYKFPSNIILYPNISYYIQFKSTVAFDYMSSNNPNYTPWGTFIAKGACISETIYKPNNSQFAKQGAVSGSLRTQKLKTNTITVNGNSFRSASGAMWANAGLYQGTNISNNYYVKYKEDFVQCKSDVPNKPTLHLISYAYQTVVFSWSLLFPICPIKFYTIFINPDVSPPISPINVSSSTSQYTINTLSYSTTYNITISATNVMGQSILSDPIIIVTYTFPTAPVLITATASVTVAGNVNLNWNAPSYNGGIAITDYVIQYRTSGGPITSGPGPWISYPHAASTATNILISGLTSGTSYDFRVAAVNVVGTGAFSNSLTTIPYPYVPEVICLNNSNNFPTTGASFGDVAFMIAFPAGSWPIGYSDFSNITITNGASVSIASPSYGNKYYVYYQQNFTGFYTALAAAGISNIAQVSFSPIANGASQGSSLIFQFSGGSSGAPSTFTTYYNPPPGHDVTQGFLSCQYASVTSNTISGISGYQYFQIGWQGYQTTVNAAWNSPSYTGTSPTQVFTPPAYNGAGYLNYAGIPKILAPNP